LSHCAFRPARPLSPSSTNLATSLTRAASTSLIRVISSGVNWIRPVSENVIRHGAIPASCPSLC
jgi:hypothetical protein